MGSRRRGKGEWAREGWFGLRRLGFGVGETIFCSGSGSRISGGGNSHDGGEGSSELDILPIVLGWG